MTVIIKNQQDLEKFNDELRKALEAGQRIELDYAYNGQKRTLEQNKKSWAMYKDLAAGMPWNNQLITKEQWKAILTAGFAYENMPEHEWKMNWQPAISGNFMVFTGDSTRDMAKNYFAAFVEYIYAFAAESPDFYWSITSEQIFKDYGIIVE